MSSPFIIGVAGGTASGKKNVCTHILSQLTTNHKKLQRRMAIIALTDFYRDLTNDELCSSQLGNHYHHHHVNHPDMIDWKLLDQFLTKVQSGSVAQIPQFDFAHMKRTGFADFPVVDVIIFHGTLVLYKRKIREKLNIRLFVDVDCDVRLSSIVTRDTIGLNNRPSKPLDHILDQWLQWIKPAFEDFILPTKKHADVVIPRGFDNTVALNLLIRHIDQILTNPHLVSRPCTVPNSPLVGATPCDSLGRVSGFSSPINASLHRDLVLPTSAQSKFSEVPN